MMLGRAALCFHFILRLWETFKGCDSGEMSLYLYFRTMTLGGCVTEGPEGRTGGRRAIRREVKESDCPR